MSDLCGVCGTNMNVPEGGFKMPPTLLELVQGDVSITDDIHQPVWVYLCKEHNNEVKEMVDDGESPLSEFHVDNLKIPSRRTMLALIGKDEDESEQEWTPETLEESMVRSALATIGNKDEKWVSSGDILRSTVILMGVSELRKRR